MQKVTKWYTPKSKTVKNLLKEAEDFYVADFEGGSRSRALRKLRMPNKEHKVKSFSFYHFQIWNYY
jgi:hypothetical protein